VLLHSDAIAENGPSAEGTGGIDRDDTDACAFGAQRRDQSVGERALTCPGISRDPDQPRTSGVAVDTPQKVTITVQPIVDRTATSRHRADVSIQESGHEVAHVVITPFRKIGTSRCFS
jgi:hypothetical protein